MNTNDSAQISAAAAIAERICALPAVATQDWCDQAASALLDIRSSSTSLVMIGRLSDDGRIEAHEATGVAGAHRSDITTTIGRTASTPAMAPTDARDPKLASLRASLAQASTLGWTPGRLTPGQCLATDPDARISDWRNGALAKRWEGLGAGGLLLGAVGLPSDQPTRALIVELGFADPTGERSVTTGVLEATLPILAKRAILAIGSAGEDGASAWLTPREQVILNQLLLGKSVRQIAEELGRSPHTVHDHVKSLHRKLHASSRGELVARALGYAAAFDTTEPKVTVVTSEPTMGARPAHIGANEHH